jgi:hypothetical protein
MPHYIRESAGVSNLKILFESKKARTRPRFFGDSDYMLIEAFFRHVFHRVYDEHIDNCVEILSRFFIHAKLFVG